MKRRKGVSPVVSSVLLTAIVVALGTSIFLWAVLLLDSYSQGISSSNLMSEEKLKEDFIVEHAVLNDTNRVILYVRNVGDIDMKVSSIWVYNSSGILGKVSVNQVVHLEQLVVIDVRIENVSWVVGEVYHIKVVSERGNSYTTTVRAE